MNQATDIITEALQSIALASINPNPDNPRKHYDEQRLKELAASIRAQGLWEPIVLRPDPLKLKTYELVIGERRWRAAKMAGLTAIPAIVRQLSDREALEAMVLENLQREDVHPLEEAAGYRALLDYGTDAGKPVHTIISLAERIGKSESYVHSRLKLLVLIPPAREAFQRSLITAGHAVLIARLQAPEQLRALAACFKSYVTDDEEAQLKKQNPETWAELADILRLRVADPKLGVGEDYLRLASEKSLRAWIQDNINLKLKGIPWDLEDGTLVPDAGACSVCPKNSISNPLLFAELTGKGDHVCFDPACYQAKRAAFVKLQFRADKDQAKAAALTGEEYQPLRPLSEQQTYQAAAPNQKTLKAGQWLPAKKGECPNVEKGVITKGEHAGEVHLICANATCKKHRHYLEKPAKTPAPKDTAKRAADEKYQEALDEHIGTLLQKSVDGADRAALILMGEMVMDHYFYSCQNFYASGSKTDARFRRELQDLSLAKAWSLLVSYVLFHLHDQESTAEPMIQAYAHAKKLDLKKAEAEFRHSYEGAQSKGQKGSEKGVSSKKAGGSTRPSGLRR